MTSGGQAIDPDGNVRTGFEVSGSINRYDYGLIWSLLTESGAIILAEEVKIHANIQLVKINETEEIIFEEDMLFHIET